MQLIATCLALAYLRRSLSQRTTGLVTGQPLSLARGFISPSVGFIGRSGPLLSNRMWPHGLCQYALSASCSISASSSRRRGYKLPYQAARPRAGLCQPPGEHGKSAIGPALTPRLSMPPPGLLRADRAHTGLAKKGTYPGEVPARPGYTISFCRWGGGKDVPASSDSKQQAAGTAIKQAKARRAAPNSDPLVRFLSRSPARACAKSLAVSAPRRAASRSHTDMSSSCLLLQPGTRHPYAGRWPQHTAIRNPLDFARWVLPIKARGRYTLCSDIHRAEGARRAWNSHFKLLAQVAIASGVRTCLSRRPQCSSHKYTAGIRQSAYIESCLD